MIDFSRMPIVSGGGRFGEEAAHQEGSSMSPSSPALLQLAQLPPSELEQIESLEQLRALENGIRILVVETASRHEMLSVDTAADLERVRKLLSAVNA